MCWANKLFSGKDHDPSGQPRAPPVIGGVSSGNDSRWRAVTDALTGDVSRLRLCSGTNSVVLAGRRGRRQASAPTATASRAAQAERPVATTRMGRCQPESLAPAGRRWAHPQPEPYFPLAWLVSVSAPSRSHGRGTHSLELWGDTGEGSSERRGSPRSTPMKIFGTVAIDERALPPDSPGRRESLGLMNTILGAAPA